MGPLPPPPEPDQRQLLAATVYVIDDDRDTANLTAALLARDGYVAIPFHSPADFLRNLPADCLLPRCLITDLCMPGMDGLQLQAALAARDLRMPIIFMTGLGEVTSAVEALKGGACDFLQKPVHIERLRGAVAAAIERDLQACERLLFCREVERKLQRLTPREREVLELLAVGGSTKEIGRDLHISIKTVFVHRARILQKLEVDSLVALSRLMNDYRATSTPVASLRDA